MVSLLPQLQQSRFLQRWAVKDFERFAMEAKHPDGQSLALSICNLSSFGILVSSSGSQPLLAKGDVLGSVRILHNRAEVGSYRSAKVAHVSESSHGYRYGLMFLPDSSLRRPFAPSALGDDGRSTHRVSLDHRYAPQAWCAHPLHYDTYCNFQLVDISLGGARLLSLGGHNTILQGAKIRALHLMLPTVGEVTVAAQVVAINAAASGQGTVTVSVRFEGDNSRALKKIARFAMLFAPDGHRLLSQMRAMGNPVKGIKSHLTFGYVSNPEDYQGVLELRQKAYSRAGKIPASMTAAAMADVYDNNSVIVIASTQGKVIGSIRITHCTKPEDQLELDASGVVPSWLPRKHTIEVSRLCVDAEFENTDLVFGLIERSIEVAVKLEAHWVVTSSVNEMVGYYNKLGFKEVGKPFNLATLNNVPHRLLLQETLKVVHHAKGINPLFWQVSYAAIMMHLTQFQFAEKRSFSLWQQMQLRVGARIYKARTGKSLNRPKE